MNPINPFNRLFISFCAMALVLSPVLKGEEKHDPSKMVLDSARRAYNDQEFGFAAARFREFLSRFAGNPQTIHAQFGLALALIDSKSASDEELTTAVQQLTEVVKVKDFSEQRHALYYLGLGYRRLGESVMAKAESSQPPSAALLATAIKHFETAALQFAVAADAFKAGVPAPLEGKELPSVWEWVARSKSEQVEMLLRAGKLQDVLSIAEAFLAEKWAGQSRYLDLVRYHYGFSSFSLGGYAKAKESLDKVPLPDDPVSQTYAEHARYILGRARHLTDESEGAFEAYNLVLTRYIKAKEAAEAALKKPEDFKDKPDEKARLEGFVNSPPGHVERVRYYRGALYFELNKHEEAFKAFTEFAQAHPKSDLLADSLMRRSISLWHLGRFKECMDVLNPLILSAPQMADEAQLWLGRAQLSIGQSAKPEEQAKAYQAAMDHFRKAIEILKPKSATDAVVKKRLSEVLIHLADTQMLTGNFKDAGTNYLEILTLGVDDRGQELLYRQATSLHLAGEYEASDKLCEKFVQTYPESELMDQILFRAAENGYFQAADLEKNLRAEDAERGTKILKAYAEAGVRYQKLVHRYPKFPQLNLARLGLAASLYRQERFEEADATLTPIPPEDFKDEIAQGLPLRADCLLRQVPDSWELEADRAKRDTYLNEAIKLLKVFLGNSPNHPQRPEALMKLGMCYQLKAEPMEASDARKELLNLAQGVYVALISKFPDHALAPQANIENAKSLIAAGDLDGGIRELAKFTQPPLNTSPLAPVAALRQAQALRSKGKAAEAVILLENTRKQHEEALIKSGPPRDTWAVHLHFQHGLALKDSGKSAESKTVMEDFLKRYPNRPEAPEAGLRIGQAMALDADNLLATAEAALKKTDLTPEASTQAQTQKQSALLSYGSCSRYFSDLLALKAKQRDSAAWPRVHYELAWCYRATAMEQMESARAQLTRKAAEAAGGKEVALHEVPLNAIPVVPAETLMMDQFKIIIATWPDLLIASDARFELADHHARRGRFDESIPLLTAAQTKPSSEPLREKVNFLLGSCLFERKQDKESIPLFESVMANVSSPLAPHAVFRGGEAHLRLKEYDKAAAKFKLFIDQPAFQNIPGLSDRALLRLAFAQAQQGQHTESQTSAALLISRFPQSPFLIEALFAQGQALQAQKGYDAAIKAYQAVIDATDNEFGARAQYQIGLCNMETKLYDAATQNFLKVVYTYAYPDWNAAALCQAADASIQQKKTAEAKEYLKRVMTEFSATQYSALAKAQLEKLP
ncbi:MAG: tetratricopeptide repeat protein [Planctomycetota bacterium]|nr:tetratricopeptide repeat protein [Planctomycetota bacterium]